MVGLIASKPMKITRGKEEVNGPRKPKERSGKLIGIMRGKEEVNGPRKPKN